MIKREEIKKLFLEQNSINVEPFIHDVVRLTCYPLSNPDATEEFIGTVEYDDNFPMLTVGFPWRENEKTSFAKKTAVSPKLEEPKAYYILTGIEKISDDIVNKWFKAGKKFCDLLSNQQ